MLRKSVTAEDVVDFLNSLLYVDRDTVTEVFLTRTPCNQELADHPSVQVRDGDPPTVSPLGILNGLFGTIEDNTQYNGYGAITAVVDGHEIVGFELTPGLGPSPTDR